MKTKLLALVLLFATMATPAFAMTRPLFGIVKGSVSNVGSRFTSVDGNSVITTNSANSRQPVSVSGVIGDLVADTSGVPPGVGTSYTITLQKGAIDTALICTISDTATSCSDHTHQISVVPGDTLGWKIVPSNTPALTTISIAGSFTGTNPGETDQSGGGGSANMTNTAESYDFFNGNANNLVVEASSTMSMPTSGIFDTLYFGTSVAASAGKSYQLFLMKNDATTTLTCTITGAVQTQCNDSASADAVSFVQGDTFAIAVLPSGTPTGAVGSWSVRFRPSTDGEALTMAHGTTLSTVSRFMLIEGVSGNTTNEGTATSTAPVAFGLRKLYFLGDAVHTGAQTRTITVRRNAVNTDLAATITSAGLTAIDNSHMPAFAIGDLVSVLSTVANTPPSEFKWSLTAVTYIPPIPPAAALSPSKFRIFGGKFSIVGGKIKLQ